MKHLLLPGILAIFFFASCKDDSQEDNAAGSATMEESTDRLDTVLSGNDLGVLNQLPFSRFADAQNKPVKWSEFRMVTSLQDTLHSSAFQPDSVYYRKYGRFLKYSPDSSLFIDLDSYNIDFQRNRRGAEVPVEIGPDTEVSLVDLAQKQKIRLLFLGPGNGVEDAGWIDNNSAVLIGYHEKDTSKIKTAVIWRFHLPTKTFYVYESGDSSVPRQLQDWRKERFR